MSQLEEYKDALEALGTLFTFEVRPLYRWRFDEATVLARIEIGGSILSIAYPLPMEELLATSPREVLRVCVDAVSNALLHPKAHCYVPPVTLTYETKEVQSEG